MDANNEMMFWYLAYSHKMNTKAGQTPHQLRTRSWFARICGHAALRVGLWLLDAESRTGMENANWSQQQTVVPHP